MLFLIFAFSSSLVDNIYSLLPPFAHTSIGEIGNWSIRGQTISQKKVIHLTSTVGGISGGLCQLSPTNVKDWVIEAEISLIGDTFLMTFGPQLCPNISSKFFNAFNLTFTPISGLEKMKVSISGPEIFPSKEATISYKAHPEKMRIRILKTDTKLRVATVADGKENDCFEVQISELYGHGYISLFSFSPENCENCITNLYHLSFFPMSEIDKEIDVSIIEKNRKYLEESKNERQFMKMMRRAKMLTVSKYVDSIHANNEILNPSDKDKLSDSLLETKEMVQRAKQCISAENLTYFIDNKMMPVIDKAAARFERVADALWQMKVDMLSLWDDSTNALRSMNSEIQNDCKKLKLEVLGAAQQMQLNYANIGDGNLQSEVISSIESHESSMASKIEKLLFLICIVEFVGYLTFFINYHRRTIKKHY